MKKPADREKALTHLAEAALLMQRGGYAEDTEKIKDVLRNITAETLSVKASA
jgi:hypothetical protein